MLKLATGFYNMATAVSHKDPITYITEDYRLILNEQLKVTEGAELPNWRQFEEGDSPH